MKGCLAVWIVWVSSFHDNLSIVPTDFKQAALALYERMVEDFLSFFIPFYDELKSLVLLFLIVTRARVSQHLDFSSWF